MSSLTSSMKRIRKLTCISSMICVTAVCPSYATQSSSGEVFRDTLSGGGYGPEMVVIPAGSFILGAPLDESEGSDDESPKREIQIGYQFAVGKYEVTWAEWDACVADGGCDDRPVARAGGDNGWGRGTRPAIHINWNDAQAYVNWLTFKTGKWYRLLSETEWEYVARADSAGRFSWGDDDPICSRGARNGANFSGCRSRQTETVGFSAANSFGVHDLHGNVWEWTEDCYYSDYSGIPTDGTARYESDCSQRVFRGGGWSNDPKAIRSANRYKIFPTSRNRFLGFRVATTF